MGFLSKRKNKKFSYTPRYYKGEGSPYEMKQKFDGFRKTVGETPGLMQKITNASEELGTTDRAVKRRILIIVAILVILFLAFFNFDLSIFFSKL